MPNILRTRSVLAVQDLARAVHYYRDVLGFTEDSITAAGWSFLSLGAFHVMLGECRDELSAEETGNHSWFMHLLVDDADAFCESIRARGAEIVTPPTDRDYGLREFILRTPDGHRIVVGHALAGTP